MASNDKKISELIEKTTIDDTDLFPMVDTKVSPRQTKKITGKNMKAIIVSNKVNSIPPDGFVKVDNIYLEEINEELILIT